MTTNINRLFSIAPMLDWTDRHCRYFHRQLTRCALLYTEMITTGALLHGDVDRHLQFNPEEHPVALQLGGSDPADLATASKLVESRGYDEINLNVGCPSDRVQNGAFGACLMAEPQLVADCIRAMQETVSIPVTIKHRIGIDEQDSYEELVNFIGTVANSGCNTFIIHARKAWLKGLSPKQNREIPPLSYESVYRIKQEFPALEIIINGGTMNLEESRSHLQQVDGVMIGRAAYHSPWLLSQIDSTLYGQQDPCTSPREAVEAMIPYIEKHLAEGGKVSHVTRHMLGLFSGMPGARRWRRILSEGAIRPDADASLLLTAMNEVTID
ncbi:tRNA dihydrouridine(20/20a) synthase DusA [Solemya velum gill symbiont]|uniref:tRNA dihydrouridine(20/20a) synthase DusA n=1 Tax=Solemya velum gill symbiont TaxID=2340 RepID=UPI0009985582|nr:tRNA dihydrouridine(20/20a) synthase DusA [Solemya velum gill symbiont]OOZ80060.1 tRNA dihydrouridine(20/20a) synthase DusA [Solemya velum gill symbiont]